jgi:hypothetical protein
MRRFVVLAAVAGSLAAPAVAAADPDIRVTSLTASPNPARTGDPVTISITITNAGSTAPAYPVFMRLELQSFEFGTTGAPCPPGATSTNNNACRLGGPLAPGESATMTVGGFSPEASTVDFRGVGYANDDPNHDNDAQSGRLVIEGPTNDGSGGRGGVDAGLGPFGLARPTLKPSRFRAGRSTRLSVELDRPAELALVLERQDGGRWRRVPSSARSQEPAGTATLKIGPRHAGKTLAAGRYRVKVIATSRTGERATAGPVTFTVTDRTSDR